MELHAIDGTKSETGRARVPGTRKRAKPPAGQPATPTARVLVAGRGALKVPRGLDRECAAAWKQLRSECDAVLDQADAAMLETAAVALGRFRQARASIKVHGLTIEVVKTGRDGSEYVDVRENPAVKLERDYASMLHRAMVELGIGPSARARFSGAGVEGKKPADVLEGLGELRAIAGGKA